MRTINHLGRSVMRAAALLALSAVAVLAFSTRQSATADDMKKSGTVAISQTQIAFIGSGNLGGGELQFNGKTYKFTVGGLGIGGFGISTMKATGTVYNLNDVNQFAGTYIQGRYGFAAGTSGSGDLWLKNDAGVVMELKTERQGLALSLGGDAVYIGFE
jgi:hypothetical protein